MAKTHGFGTKLLVKNEANSTVYLIGAVGDINGPTATADTVDVTTHDSSGGWTENLVGLKTGGSVSFELIHDITFANSGQAELQEAFKARTQREFYILLPGGTKNGYLSETVDTKMITFTAGVTKFDTQMPVKGAVSMNIELTVTGSVVWTDPD